jgi:N-acetylneuraminic acid mutarotase
MISFFILFIFTLSSNEPIKSQELYWEFGEPMPINRTELTAEVIDGKIYVMGGADYLKDGIMDLVEIYDPETDDWSESTPLPDPIDHTAAVVYDNKLYIIGGFLDDKTATDKVWSYNPKTDVWTEELPLPTARGALAAEVIDGNIYVIGGIGLDHKPVATNEMYSIENQTWIIKEPLVKPRHHIASAVVDEKLYILGGRVFGNGEPSEINAALTNMDDNLRYDPKSNDWTKLDSMEIRRSGFTASVIDGQIYAIGGQTAKGGSDMVERYNPILDKWFVAPNMHIVKSGQTSISHNDTIYVFGGQHYGLQSINNTEILKSENGRASAE